MALQVECGSFSSQAGIGDQTITLADSGLTPIVVIVEGVAASGSSASTAAILQMGAATSTTARWSISGVTASGSGSVNSARSLDTDEVIARTDGNAGAYSLQADFVSFAAGQFTINWATAAAGTSNFRYIAIGGSGVSAAVGTFATGTSAADVSETGVGFTPKLVLFAASRADTTEGLTTSLGFGLGAMDDAGNESFVGWFETDAADPSAEFTYYSATKCMGQVGTAAVVWEADFVSMDSDGFTINLSTAPAASRTVCYVALGGDIETHVGQFAQSTTAAPDDEAETGVGFEPDAIMVASIGSATTGFSSANNGTIAIGAASGTAARWSHAAGADDNVGTTVCQSGAYTDQICLDLSGSTPTENARGDIASFDSDGFTINWDTTDATARNWWYWAIAAQAVGGGGRISRLAGAGGGLVGEARGLAA